jgi:hypothetical protein
MARHTVQHARTTSKPLCPHPHTQLINSSPAATPSPIIIIDHHPEAFPYPSKVNFFSLSPKPSGTIMYRYKANHANTVSVRSRREHKPRRTSNSPSNKHVVFSIPIKRRFIRINSLLAAFHVLNSRIWLIGLLGCCSGETNTGGMGENCIRD